MHFEHGTDPLHTRACSRDTETNAETRSIHLANICGRCGSRAKQIRHGACSAAVSGRRNRQNSARHQQSNTHSRQMQQVRVDGRPQKSQRDDISVSLTQRQHVKHASKSSSIENIWHVTLKRKRRNKNQLGSMEPIWQVVLIKAECGAFLWAASARMQK